MNEVDLHTHTTASDGTHTPAQLISRVAKLAVKVIAVTDHDSTAGVAEAQAVGAKLGVEVIAGVEINTDVPGAEFYILGYFVEPSHAELNVELAYSAQGCIGRACTMPERLTANGRAGAVRAHPGNRGRRLGRPAPRREGRRRTGPRGNVRRGVRKRHRPRQPGLRRAHEVHAGGSLSPDPSRAGCRCWRIPSILTNTARSNPASIWKRC